MKQKLLKSIKIIKKLLWSESQELVKLATTPSIIIPALLIAIVAVYGTDISNFRLEIGYIIFRMPIVFALLILELALVRGVSLLQSTVNRKEALTIASEAEIKANTYTDNAITNLRKSLYQNLTIYGQISKINEAMLTFYSLYDKYRYIGLEPTLDPYSVSRTLMHGYSIVLISDSESALKVFGLHPPQHPAEYICRNSTYHIDTLPDTAKYLGDNSIEINENLCTLLTKRLLPYSTSSWNNNHSVSFVFYSSSNGKSGWYYYDEWRNYWHNADDYEFKFSRINCIPEPIIDSDKNLPEMIVLNISDKHNPNWELKHQRR